jgi:hypothetical protein
MPHDTTMAEQTSYLSSPQPARANFAARALAADRNLLKAFASKE